MQLNFEIGRWSLTRLLIREKQEIQREVNVMTEANVSIGEMEVGGEREREESKKKWGKGGTGREMWRYPPVGFEDGGASRRLRELEQRDELSSIAPEETYPYWPTLDFWLPDLLDNKSVFFKTITCVHTQLLQSSPIPCNPIDYSLSGSSIHGILHATILQWVASSRGSFWPRDQTSVSCISCIRGGFLTTEPLRKPFKSLSSNLLQQQLEINTICKIVVIFERV